MYWWNFFWMKTSALPPSAQFLKSINKNSGQPWSPENSMKPNQMLYLVNNYNAMCYNKDWVHRKPHCNYLTVYIGVRKAV